MSGKNKGIYRIFKNKVELDYYNETQRHFARVLQLDMVTIALGRMGFNEDDFREFDKVLAKVQNEYFADFREDLEADKHMEYSRDCLDRELKQYVGDMFVPAEKRYEM